MPDKVPDNWQEDEIQAAIEELEQSIEERQRCFIEEFPGDDKGGHGDELQAERDFLEKLRRRLQDFR
jgi:hypothetical protein